MPPPSGFSVGVSPFRRPDAGDHADQRQVRLPLSSEWPRHTEAKSRGFDNALVLDMLGNVAETGTSNIFMVKDGVALTPSPNGSFLNGITRQRVIGLLRQSGLEVRETALTMADFLDADEIFSTGNYSKVVPITRIEDRELSPARFTTRPASSTGTGRMPDRGAAKPYLPGR
jgi:branched-chain amino acid aminotransferase